MLDGFYVGYLTSVHGYGVVMFVFHGTDIVGVDAASVKFDGTFSVDENTGSFSGNIKVDAPPNIELLQGISSGSAGLRYEVPFTLPKNFLEAPFIKLETPFGPVNIRLEKLRDLGAAS